MQQPADGEESDESTPGTARVCLQERFYPAEDHDEDNKPCCRCDKEQVQGIQSFVEIEPRDNGITMTVDWPNVIGNPFTTKKFIGQLVKRPIIAVWPRFWIHCDVCINK